MCNKKRHKWSICCHMVREHSYKMNIHGLLSWRLLGSKEVLGLKLLTFELRFWDIVKIFSESGDKSDDQYLFLSIATAGDWHLEEIMETLQRSYLWFSFTHAYPKSFVIKNLVYQENRNLHFWQCYPHDNRHTVLTVTICLPTSLSPRSYYKHTTIQQYNNTRFQTYPQNNYPVIFIIIITLTQCFWRIEIN